MFAAWILTLLAFAGILAGLLLGASIKFSDHLAAAAGGLLFGISLFLVIPEIAVSSGWLTAVLLAIAACCALMGLDMLLVHTGHSPRHGVIGPLLAAAAIHSFLDGWSVRALSHEAVAQVAVPLGLALHKIPEGVALGWIARKSFPTILRAAIICALVESLTLLGAFTEPGANQSGILAFGPWWSAVVLAIVAGGFLFLGLHALMPARSRRGVVPIFLATLFTVGGIALAHGF